MATCRYCRFAVGSKSCRYRVSSVAFTPFNERTSAELVTQVTALWDITALLIRDKEGHLHVVDQSSSQLVQPGNITASSSEDYYILQ
jgi:hypothetical protein